MSFFAKIKQFFGAGTVKVELTAPASVEKASGQLEGSVKLVAASDQQVLEVTVLLEGEPHRLKGVSNFEPGRGHGRPAYPGGWLYSSRTIQRVAPGVAGMTHEANV